MDTDGNEVLIVEEDTEHAENEHETSEHSHDHEGSEEEAKTSCHFHAGVEWVQQPELFFLSANLLHPGTA